jgi:lipoprotein-anchoring transpeptidase ErfK/SrfK
VTLGWKLDRRERADLLKQFPPTWPDVIADHVTYQPDPSGGKTSAVLDTTGEIVGQADDGDGVQTFVVSIGGSVERPDGSTYHITWSIDRGRGRHPVDSNDVLRRLGWRAIDSPVPIRLTAASF